MMRHGSLTFVSASDPECKERLLSRLRHRQLLSRLLSLANRQSTCAIHNAGVHLQNKSRLCVNSEPFDGVQTKRHGSDAMRRDETRERPRKSRRRSSPCSFFLHLFSLSLFCIMLLLAALTNTSVVIFPETRNVSPKFKE